MSFLCTFLRFDACLSGLLFVNVFSLVTHLDFHVVVLHWLQLKYHWRHTFIWPIYYKLFCRASRLYQKANPLRKKKGGGCKLTNIFLLSSLPTCSVTVLERVSTCWIQKHTTLLIRLFCHVLLHLSCAYCSTERQRSDEGWSGGQILLNTCTRLSSCQGVNLSFHDGQPNAK